MSKAVLIENKDVKVLKSPDYNFIFNKHNGFFARWGETKEADPDFSPYGPELVDIEISTICSGVKGIGVCKFCYKSNTPNGTYMSLETFKKVFHNLPKTVTQIAFGIGDILANPDMWAIFDYSRENGVVPNVTVNGEGITDEIADTLVAKCGAVAVSVYDREKSFDTIKKLTDRGLKQVNIHYMICEETYEGALRLLQDRQTDPRLAKLNAIVLLSLKPKGRATVGQRYTRLSDEKFKHLVDYALAHGIGVGFDSCGAGKFMKAVEGNPQEEMYKQMAEPCESTKFSMYINTDGQYFPCSFIEGEVVENGGDWREGLDVVNCKDFLKDVWHNEKTQQFRTTCVACTKANGNCPHYKV